VRPTLRILMVSPQFRPLVGGYERSAERLALALCERGHRVTVVAERREAAWPRSESIGAVELIRLRCIPRPRWHMLSAGLSLLAFLLLHGWRFDVVHVHQAGWTAALCVVFGRLSGRPVVLKLAGSGPEGSLAVLARARPALLLASLHRRVDALIATSSRMAQEAEQLGIPAERVERIGNPVDTGRFRPLEPEPRDRLRAELGLAGITVVLFTGRLSPEKNLAALLDAWAQLGPPANAVLALAGDGPERSAVEARAAGLGASVRCLGALADPLAWYQAADLFVLPSLYEGLSNSLLEAIACGLPVVSTPVSGSEDVLGEADVGRLAGGFDASALAAGLAPLLQDAARRSRCGAAAREHALARFSQERVTEQVEALYRALCTGSRTRAGSHTPIDRA